MKYLLPLLLIALPAGLSLVQPALAQRPNRPGGTIAGTVVDAESGATIPTATVAVWRTADSTLATGAVTDDRGAFAVQGIRPGNYYLVFSFVGYANKVVDDVQITPRAREVDLGSITLVSDTQVLDEIQIAAEREPVQIQIDRTVYNTADDPMAAGGTATNVLETIPSVNVDIDGNVSLRGSGNVAILVNGRSAPVGPEFLAAYLRQLPASSIDRVEVMPNPSAKFDPEGMGGIINIVLKEDTDTGLGGTLSLSGDQRGGYSGTGMLSYGNGPLTLAASYGYRHEDDIASGESFRINRYADPLTYLDQNEDEDETGSSHLINLSADYAVARKTTLTSSVQFGIQDEVENELNTFLQLDASQLPTLNYERLTREDDSRWDADFGVGLQLDFGTPSAGGAACAPGSR
ncbi:MAG: carboxypeptidase regulatory-like domain-containing protein [Rhodothermia bacterium]|nr:carboxypeptidase regulatory-like domain-containing protein [Rhodothermia bacterium]